MIPTPAHLMTAVLLAVLTLGASAPRKYRTVLPAPTYYIAARVHDCHSGNQIDVHGATNVPPGATLRLFVAAFDGEGWTYFSDDFTTRVGEEGLFRASVTPQKGKKFRQNLIVRVSFGPTEFPQPKSVLEEVGKKGEKMLDWNNPQLGQWSGWEYYVETLARAQSCPSQ